ncbi:MAG: glycogen synthase [Bacteroidetes bacterium]|nr:MAG: glycogen synthase [Bacteroidota bacterium]PIE88755.1 MAG: glycogen synthase [Bacteroidota bacterium]
MNKKKVLFISQEITPYLPETQISKIGRFLPQGIQERGKEIRTFMPRFGNINERRNQLHEVIRLSGMNLIIDDNDHPLIIKVASIQSARMQIYFIDNEEYFHRKATIKGKDGKFFEDNDERMLFFARGVLETVKKLGWPPDIVHCHGWMAALAPLYLKTAYGENPLYQDTRIITSLYDDDFTETLSLKLPEKLAFDGIKKKDLAFYQEPNYINLMKGAISYSDALIMGSEKINEELAGFAKESKKQTLDYQEEENYIEAINAFYESITAED